MERLQQPPPPAARPAKSSAQKSINASDVLHATRAALEAALYVRWSRASLDLCTRSHISHVKKKNAEIGEQTATSQCFLEL